ncbi:uncharacterized protein LOC144135303 [Amblyomma americanum]
MNEMSMFDEGAMSMMSAIESSEMSPLEETKEGESSQRSPLLLLLALCLILGMLGGTGYLAATGPADDSTETVQPVGSDSIYIQGKSPSTATQNEISSGHCRNNYHARFNYAPDDFD